MFLFNFATSFESRRENTAAKVHKINNKTKEKMKKNDLTLIKTQAEIEREAKNEAIVAEYSAMRKANPRAKSWRIFATLAERHEMTSMGVMRVLQRKKIYQTKNGRTKK